MFPFILCVESVDYPLHLILFLTSLYYFAVFLLDAFLQRIIKFQIVNEIFQKIAKLILELSKGGKEGVSYISDIVLSDLEDSIPQFS